MEICKRIIFVGQSGSCREPMAAGILKEFTLKYPVEVLARGLVVLFPEPMNQKALCHSSFRKKILQKKR